MQSGDNNSPSKLQERYNPQQKDLNQTLEARRQTKKKEKQRIALMQHANQQFKNFFEKYLNSALSCPISQQLMTDPVVVSSGFTFDRKNISDSIRVAGWKCPMSRQTLKQNQFTPNKVIRSLVDEYQKFIKRQESITGEDLLKEKRMKKNPTRLSIEEYEKIYKRLEIDPKKRLLKHDFKKVVMEDFVRCNWNMIVQMDLTSCEINDEGIEMMLKHGKTHFKKLRMLHLDINEIKNVRQIERLPELRFLYIRNNKDLSQETKEYFHSINEKKGNLKIKY